MKKTNSNIQLAIRLNRNTDPTKCAVCKNKFEPICAPELTLAELTLADAPSLVCRECGRQHVPALASLLDLGERAALDYGEYLRLWVRQVE